MSVAGLSGGQSLLCSTISATLWLCTADKEMAHVKPYSISVEDIKTKTRFAEYMQKYYPEKDALEVMNEIDKWLTQIEKQDE